MSLDAKLSDGESCKWTVVPVPITPPEPGKCKATMVIARNTSSTVTVEHAQGTASAKIEVDDIVIVAMGDSYAAGEGSPDRPAVYTRVKTPTSNDWAFRAGAIKKPGAVLPVEWFEGNCHRSLLSWPVLASLRLALEHPHAVVRLVNVACSGAEFMDGFFVAQEKADIPGRSGLTKARDGIGKEYKGRMPSGAKYISRSQVNAVRDALCEASVDAEDVSFPGLPNIASTRSCNTLRFKPDALLMTGGGNDIKFGPAVMGVLMPDVARSKFLAPVFLKRARDLARAITPADLTRRATEFSAVYEDYISAAAVGAMVEPSKTVLVAYPNPIAPLSETGKLACRDYRDRLEASFLAFGPAVRETMPRFIGRNVHWVVELSRGEEGIFTREAYPALQKMQKGLSLPFTVVDWHPQNVAGKDAGRSFSTRLLCSAEPDGSKARERQDSLEPIFFCQSNVSTECNKSPYTVRKSLDSWRFVAPDRRMVNATNDALLAQRTWGIHQKPKFDELAAALSGTFHPVPESYAVAADSAYVGLCSVLRRTSTHRVCDALR